MKDTTTIRQALTSQLSGLRDNTKVIENSDLLDFSNIEEGFLTVYATWSRQSVINCTHTIRALYEQNYKGQIIVVDTDCMTPGFQIKMFGQVCHGWGEIFIIHNGKISNKYLGKDSFANYKVDSDRQK